MTGETTKLGEEGSGVSDPGLDSDTSVLKVLKPGSDALVVFFSSLSVSRPVPAFEFRGVSRGLSAHLIHIRDLDRCWYQNGLRGVSNDVDATVDFLKAEICKINPKRLMFVGGSMGGFAALLHATLLRRGDVLAIGPQTYLSPVLRWFYRNKRSNMYYRRMYRKCRKKPRYWDLKMLFLNGGYVPRTTAFFAAANKVDQTHYKRIKQFPEINLVLRPVAQHGVSRLFEDRSVITELIQEHLDAM